MPSGKDRYGDHGKPQREVPGGSAGRGQCLGGSIRCHQRPIAAR